MNVTENNPRPEDTVYGIQCRVVSMEWPQEIARITGAGEVLIDWANVALVAEKFNAGPTKPADQWSGFAFILQAIRDGVAKDIEK